MTLTDLADRNKDVLRLSTIFEAGEFRGRLADDGGVARAVEWCVANGITRVFIENFRTGYDAPPGRVRRAGEMFRAAGVDVAGGVTPTSLGKPSTGWKIVCCYTDRGTQEKLQEVMETAAGLFGEVMIDDFLFTDCECEACVAARGARGWSAYRRELMLRVSRERILGPARRVNPRVRVILKYPQWYDTYHERGYDVAAQTEAFDLTWAGTELRDPDHKSPTLPRVPQYEGFWVMRWLSHLAGGEGGKCGGGWFDEYATSPTTYVEQAWQTVLGGAREMVLFHYGSLNEPRGEACLAALRPQLPALFDLARLVRERPLTRGVLAPKPPNSDAGDGRYFYDYAGMLGLPLVPGTRVEAGARSAVVSAENAADPGAVEGLRGLLARRGRAVVTDGFFVARPEAEALAGDPNVLRLEVKGDPASLVGLGAGLVGRIRAHLLEPLGVVLEAPTRVAVTLLGEDLAAVSNFGNEPAEVALTVDGRRGRAVLRIPQEAGLGEGPLPARSLTVFRFGS